MNNQFSNQFLVVDDNALVCTATARLVEHLTGWEARCCSSAEEALMTFKAAPAGRFAFAISDYEMPRMNGLELGSFLRALAPGMPLVLMTGNPGGLAHADIVAHGYDCMLAKPLDLAIIRETLRRLLPPFNNSAPRDTQSLYERGVSFFERSRGIQFLAA